MSKPASRSGGFTLIEIIVVVAIIGLLMSVAAFKFAGVQANAEITATRLRMNGVQTALERYRIDNHKYPSAADGLKVLTQAPANRSESYLDEAQINDAWGTPLQYSIPGKNAKAYDLVSYGADQASGGDKENADFSCWETDAAKKP